MSGIVERLKSQSSSSKMGPGKALSVYDGRKWPVVKCGAVYVTDEDKTKTVTKNVISLSSASEEKKKQKSSKYTVAIGSSFGHVHSFLKDSDNVLKSYEKTKAEDKCLLLIRKPKSASKQMLKAHSWADVSLKDMHLRQADGSLKQDPYNAFKDRFKKKSDLSLPPDEWNSLASQSSPFKGPTANQNSSFKSHSSVDEGKEESKSDIVIAHNKLTEGVPNISNSYPYIKKGNRHISQSLADLTESSIEVNNNKNMGGVLSQGHARPKGPPPAVPPRTKASAVEKYRNTSKSVSNSDNTGSAQNKNRSYERTENRPDIISNVNVRKSPGDKARDSRPDDNIQKRVKHDSGFHSEAPLSSDEMYTCGFKQDLSKSVKNGNHMTSSPKSSRQQQNAYKIMQRPNSDPRQPMAPTGHQYYTKGPSPGNTRNHGPSPGRKENNGSANVNDRVKPVAHRAEPSYVRSVQRNQSAGPDNRNRQNQQVRDRNIPTGQVYPDTNKNKLNERTEMNSENRNQQSGSKQYENRSKSSEKIVQRRSNEFRERKSLSDVREGQILTIDNKESVIKAHSLGDLSTGCTFSLVGQKKLDMDENTHVPEFSGTQLMKHIRNYKEMAQNGGSGSLPFRGKALDDMDYYNQYYGEGHQSVKGGYSNFNKLKHYGSLQHLPMSAETGKHQNGAQQPQAVRNREKTPLKPRRCLPQPPGDVQVKKRQMTDIMINRIGADSSSTSPSSSNSNREGSTEPRPGGISATPSVSDREVFDLLHGNRNDSAWNKRSVKNVCNNNKQNSTSKVPPSYNECVNNGLRKSGSFGSHEQGSVPPSGGRLSESGQTTLTSQSTIDSGYITNDPDPETLSTSSYAKTLKQSAHNMYTTHKLYKSGKGDHSQKQTPNMKGDRSNNSNITGNQYNTKNAKDSHTRTWLENHQGTYMSDHLKLNLKTAGNKENVQDSEVEKRDKNNNRHPKIPENNVTELDLTQNAPIKPERTFQYGKQTLTHHKSELSAKDIERMSQDQGQFTCRSKGKSISMAQGLNLRASSSEPPGGSFLSKSQPKFTGSLKDLIGTDRQIVPIETLKLESSYSTNTLPGSWKFQAQTRPECSLKFFGKPSLFQLLQNYNLYAVRVRIPENFVIMENVRLIECEVVLPTPWMFGKDSSSPLSPKGSYAKLGGPNSAFRPVSVVNTSPIKSVSMVTVMELSNQMTELIESGQLRKGDLIIEVNERLVMGEDLPTLTTVFQACQGELLLTVARDRARDNQPDRDTQSTSPTDEDFRRMEQKINELTTELRKKDRTLKQLSALLPWPQPSSKGKNSDGKDDEAYVCSLSEDEFIV